MYGPNVSVPINSAVSAARDPVIGPEVVKAYVGASRLGFRILAGIAVLQLVLCLGLKKVVLDDGSKGTREDGAFEMEVVEGSKKEKIQGES